MDTCMMDGGRIHGSGQPARDLATVGGDEQSVVVIREGGCYVLSSHLRGARGRDGVRIEADGVMLDLGGRAVLGCEFSRAGIVVADTVCNVRVRNGSVRGWGEVGVDLASAIRAELENVRVFDNRVAALRLGAGAVLTDCVVGGDIQTGVSAFLAAS